MKALKELRDLAADQYEIPGNCALGEALMSLHDQLKAEFESLDGFIVELIERTGQQKKGLEAELAEARKDSARLDWLEENINCGIGASGNKRLVGLSRTPYHSTSGEWMADTVRAAIDAALKGGAK